MTTLTPGYKTLPVDLDKWAATWAVMIAMGYRYVWNGKPEPLKASPPQFKDFEQDPPEPCVGGDCSGCMRYAIYHATFGAVDIGDGSFAQGERLAALGLKPTDPANQSAEDGRLRIWIHHPDALDRTGHIWATRNGVTSESFGGRGPGHRTWNALLASGHRLNELATVGFVVA